MALDFDGAGTHPLRPALDVAAGVRLRGHRRPSRRRTTSGTPRPTRRASSSPSPSPGWTTCSACRSRRREATAAPPRRGWAASPRPDGSTAITLSPGALDVGFPTTGSTAGSPGSQRTYIAPNDEPPDLWPGLHLLRPSLGGEPRRASTPRFRAPDRSGCSAPRRRWTGSFRSPTAASSSGSRCSADRSPSFPSSGAFQVSTTGNVSRLRARAAGLDHAGAAGRAPRRHGGDLPQHPALHHLRAVGARRHHAPRHRHRPRPLPLHPHPGAAAR